MTSKKFFRSEWKRIIAVLILGLIISLIQVVEPQITSKLVVSLNNFVLALILAGFSLILGILSSVLNSKKSKIEIRCKLSISNNIKLEVGRRLINSTSNSIKKYNNNERLTSIVCEADNLVENIFQLASQWFSLFTGLLVLIYTAFVSWQIFLLFLVAVIAIFFYQRSAMYKLKEKREACQTAHERTRSMIREFIEGVLDIKGQLLGPNIKRTLENSLVDETSSSVEETDVIAKNNVITSVILNSFLFAFFALGIWLISVDQLTVEELITLYMYKNYMMVLVSSINRIGTFWSVLTVSKNRINEVLKYRSVLEKDPCGSVHLHLSDVKGNLALKDVTVCVEDKTILDNISINIEANSFVGIVGQGGCGKSTLLKVLSHDIIPDSGEILLDGLNLNELDDYSIRAAIRHAPQTPFVFTMTVRENLKMANENATEKDMWKALKYADADGFVKELENGLDTVINRSSLSGSQIQRLALARIPLRTSKIILLDEATSAMDNITQSRIISTLKRVTENHTIIMVAHRLHILEDADVILYMEDGKIVDTGSYSDLYNRNSSFRKLADEG